MKPIYRDVHGTPTMIYRRTYAMLKRAGHSADKAAEIILDACRGDEWSLTWIKANFNLRRLPC